jgi:hypothetical protein
MTQTTYSVGMTVMIREDLQVGKCGNDTVIDNMLEFAGKTATITSNRNSSKFGIDIDNGAWNWTPEMFVTNAVSITSTDETVTDKVQVPVPEKRKKKRQE